MTAKKKDQLVEIEKHAYEFMSREHAERVSKSFSDNALRVMKKRYLVKREDGTQETPAEMIHRIAHAVAEVEKNYSTPPEDTLKWEKEFFEVLARKEFTPAGRTITNAGAPSPVVANCIVLPIEDSMEGIFKTLKDAALLQKAGSGLGFSFGRLRPAGTPVKASQGMASGPVSFLQVYNQAFGVIKQQGRHGANMAILPVDHPDILDFVYCKRVEGDIRNFNISVGMTDEFMKAVTETPNEPWFCRFGGEKMKPRRITRDRHGVVVKIEELDITASELYREIVENAWHNGEPGVVYLDTFNRFNTMPKTPIEATNPCGEQGLPPYDVCNLGSINLAAFVRPASQGGDGKLDLKRLEHVSMVATRFLDNVIDLFDYPVPEVQEMSRATRRIGLGVMGYADMLFQLGIRYDSPAGFDAGELVMKTIQQASHETSMALAEEKGEFPHWKDSTWYERGVKRRNTMVTTVAPTGSISMFLDTSSGIEPQFALSYTKQDKDGHTYKYLNKYLEGALKERGIYSEELMQQIILEGSIQKIDGIPQDIKDVFRVAMDIRPEDHIQAQAVFQRHVENSISKTINFPNEATVKDIEDGYILAWRLLCKGGTLYRDGSREVQVLNLNKNLGTAKSLAPGMEKVSLADASSEATAAAKDEATSSVEIEEVSKKAEQVLTAKIANGNGHYKITPRERPDIMHGTTYRLRTPYGNLFVTINEDQNGPFEVFSQLGKAGGFFMAQTEAICRMISLALRSGISVTDVIDQIKGIRGPDVAFANGGAIHSLPDAIARVLENHIKRGQTELDLKLNPSTTLRAGKDEESKATVPSNDGATVPPSFNSSPFEIKSVSIANHGLAPACPDCGNTKMIMKEGCMTCEVCGFSKCG